MFLYFCIPIDSLNYSLTVVPLGTIGGPNERLVLKWLSLCQVTRPKNRTLKFKKIANSALALATLQVVKFLKSPCTGPGDKIKNSFKSKLNFPTYNSL